MTISLAQVICLFNQVYSRDLAEATFSPLYLWNVCLRVSSEPLICTYTDISYHLFTFYSFTAARGDTHWSTWDTSRTHYREGNKTEYFFSVIPILLIFFNTIIRITMQLLGTNALSTFYCNLPYLWCDHFQIKWAMHRECFNIADMPVNYLLCCCSWRADTHIISQYTQEQPHTCPGMSQDLSLVHVRILWTSQSVLVFRSLQTQTNISSQMVMDLLIKKAVRAEQDTVVMYGPVWLSGLSGIELTNSRHQRD